MSTLPTAPDSLGITNPAPWPCSVVSVVLELTVANPSAPAGLSCYAGHLAWPAQRTLAELLGEILHAAFGEGVTLPGDVAIHINGQPLPPWSRPADFPPAADGPYRITLHTREGAPWVIPGVVPPTASHWHGVVGAYRVASPLVVAPASTFADTATEGLLKTVTTRDAKRFDSATHETSLFDLTPPSAAELQDAEYAKPAPSFSRAESASSDSGLFSAAELGLSIPAAPSPRGAMGRAPAPAGAIPTMAGVRQRASAKRVAPPPSEPPSLPSLAAPRDGGGLSPDEDDHTPRLTSHDKGTQLRRRASVRWFTRMNPNRMFPLTVAIAKGRIKQVSVADVAQAVSREMLLIPAEFPYVTIRPVMPGCQIFPAEQTVDVSPDMATARFQVLPLLVGEVPDARVELYWRDRKLTDITLPTQVNKQIVAGVLASIGALWPFLSGSLSSETGPWIARTLMAWMSAPCIGETLLGGIVAAAIVSYFANLPHEMTEETDVLGVRTMTVDELLADAHKAMTQGRYQEAKSLFEDALNVAPDHPAAQAGMVRASRHTGTVRS